MAYRQKEEIERWTVKSNPVLRFRKYMEGKRWWSEEKDKRVREEIRALVLEEFAAAEKRPKPPIQEMFTDVYDQMPWNLKEQQDELKLILKENPDQYPLDKFKESLEFLK